MSCINLYFFQNHLSFFIYRFSQLKYIYMNKNRWMRLCNVWINIDYAYVIVGFLKFRFCKELQKKLLKNSHICRDTYPNNLQKWLTNAKPFHSNQSLLTLCSGVAFLNKTLNTSMVYSWKLRSNPDNWLMFIRLSHKQSIDYNICFENYWCRFDKWSFTNSYMTVA